MAENSHDVWAVSKLKQLATTGGTHPYLVAYDSMTDQQKEYDRKASTDTLKYPLPQLILILMFNGHVTCIQVPDSMWI